MLFATYFNAGLRAYSIEDPFSPSEIAHWVPEPAHRSEDTQINDLFVDEEQLIYVTDRVGGGLFVLEAEEQLAEMMTEARL